MEGLTPVQISELVTRFEDAISTCAARLEQGLGDDRSRANNEIDHLEAELAWIQWMRENHLDHEENGFPPIAVDEHIEGMRAGIERWQAILRENDVENDPNYIHSLQDSIVIVGNILELFTQVRGLR
jgi:hypothetical protein